MAGQRTNSNSRSGNDAITEAIGDNGRIEADKEEAIIDPATIVGEIAGDGDDYVRNEDGTIKRNKDGSPRKKRGRKAGGSNSAKSAKGDTALIGSIETLAQSLMVVHMGIASLTHYDQFMLEDKEAETLAKSVTNVLQEFDIQPDPRFVAVTGLITTAGMIYGPRIYNYNEWRTEKKKEKMESAIAKEHFSTNFNNVSEIAQGGTIRQ